MHQKSIIRKALALYRKSESDQQAILDDKEIQAAYEAEDVERARAIIAKRYPLARCGADLACKLVEELFKLIPAANRPEPRFVAGNPNRFAKTLELAGKI